MFTTNKTTKKEPLAMKFSRSATQTKTHSIPDLRFEDQKLTSFSGLVIFQCLFNSLNLKSRIRGCFKHVKVTPIINHTHIALLLIVHMLLGYRDLRHVRYYKGDPLVERTLGLKRIPDASTISRLLSSADDQGVSNYQNLLTTLVIERLEKQKLKRITVDFDGSVIGTSRHAEGAAVGYNKKKKGQRSYYPLFCTISQTGQVFDVLHRSGNIHDSNGAEEFILACIKRIRESLPDTVIEVRMDSAFFSDSIVCSLSNAGVEFSISVPFERFAELKEEIESRKRWRHMDGECAYFEKEWKPKSWSHKYRFIFVRKSVKVQNKQPLQLDLFIPYEYGYEFKVVITNKTLTANKVTKFHNGRGSQENIFAELKSQNQLSYIPSRTWNANKMYMVSVLMAHNVTKELQMNATQPSRPTKEKRPTLWEFEKIDTLRKRIIQRAGRLINPQGKLTLSMAANDAVEKEFLQLFKVTDTKK